MKLRNSAGRLIAASVSPIGAFFLRFVRTLILSRLLMPSEVGATVLLLSILSASELITDVGLDRFVVITDGQTRAQAVAAARQIGIVRAVILAAIIVCFAPELSALFGARSLAGGAAWLGMVPLIYSLKNWRLDQIQQEYRYGPDAIATISGQFMALVALIPGFMLWHDHRLILLSLACEAGTYVVLSHILVGHEAVERVDSSVRRAALAYSLPLMANGICLMLIKQLDQIVVANFFDLTTLAVYALGFNLAVTPTSPLQAISQKIGLPVLGNARHTVDVYRRTSVLIIVGMTLVAAAYALLVGLALDYFVPLLYGDRYQLPAGFATFAMLSAYLRLCRGGPTMVLLQRGATRSLTVGNMAAAVGAFAGLFAGFVFRRLDAVMAGFAFGDLASFVVYLFVVRQHAPLGSTLKHCIIFTVITATAAAALWVLPDPSPAQRLLMLLVGMGAIAIDAVLMWHDHRFRPAIGPTPPPLKVFKRVAGFVAK